MLSRLMDREEIEDLYGKHAKVLVLFACASLGERARAEDMVQQVFLRLIERPVHRPDNPQAYLFTAVRNAAQNEIRSLRRMVELNDEQPWFDDLHSDQDTRDVMSERNLRMALWSLPEEQREVTVMHIWGEMTFPAIGSVLGISANTAASRYRYALAQLREQMKARRSDLHADSR
ncbi:MAG TPA: sigma-70 family RNA polymerase sigma factor [Terriglobales bacterium]